MSGGGWRQQPRAAAAAGERAEIPPASRKLVQGIKGILADRTEAEIYATLLDCDMDPDVAVERLISPEPFHEVGRKRKNKKEVKATQEARSQPFYKSKYRGSNSGIGASDSVKASNPTETILAAGNVADATFQQCNCNAILLLFLVLALSKRQGTSLSSSSSSGASSRIPTPTVAPPATCFPSLTEPVAASEASAEAAAEPMVAVLPVPAVATVFEEEEVVKPRQRRSRSEKMARAASPRVMPRRSESDGRWSRRSESDGTWIRRSSTAVRDVAEGRSWGMEDAEEFRRTVEAFIARQTRFLPGALVAVE